MVMESDTQSQSQSQAQVSAEADLRKALELRRAGRLAEAGEIYQAICERHPDHAEAHRLYGRLAWDLQQPDLGMEKLKQAAALAPDSPTPHQDLAEFYYGLGRWMDAEIELKEAAERAPEEGDYFVKIALLRHQQNDKEGARENCLEALRRQAGLLGAHQLLSALYWEAGNLEGAAEQGLALRRANTAGGDPHGYMAASLFALGRAQEILSQPPCDDDGQRLIELVILTLTAWQLGDLKTCGQGVKEAVALLGRLETAPNRGVYGPFIPYLDALLAYRMTEARPYEPAPGEEKAYAVGDSHCLSAAHLGLTIGGRPHRISPSLVIGCKAWHLVRPEHSPQRAAFENALARIPEGAKVLVSLGEVDCRYGEGLFPHLRQHPEKDCDRIVDDLVTGFIDRVLALAAPRGQEVIFLTSPARNYNMKYMATTDRPLYLQIAERFATQVKAVAAARGCGVVDLYGVTHSGEDTPRQALYIDGNHVRPSAFIEAAAEFAGAAGR